MKYLKISTKSNTLRLNCLFVSFIYPPDSLGNDRRLSIGQLLPRPAFGDTGNTMSDCFLFGFLIFFFPVYAVVKETLVLSSTPQKEPVRKLALSVFPKDTTT